jgi:hypothetical protein
VRVRLERVLSQAGGNLSYQELRAWVTAGSATWRSTRSRSWKAGARRHSAAVPRQWREKRDQAGICAQLVAQSMSMAGSGVCDPTTWLA